MVKLFRNRKSKADKDKAEVVQDDLPIPGGVPVPQESYGHVPSTRVQTVTYTQPPPQQQFQQPQYTQQQSQRVQPQYQQQQQPPQQQQPVRSQPQYQQQQPVRTQQQYQQPPPQQQQQYQPPASATRQTRAQPPKTTTTVKKIPAPTAAAAPAPVSPPAASMQPAPSRKQPPSKFQSVSHLPTNDANVTREVVKKFIADIWNRGDLDLIPEVCHRSLRFNGSVGMDRVGHEGFARMVQTIRDALSDYHCEIHSMVVEGNKAFVRMRFTGRHTGALLGFEPTGRQVAWMGASEFTIKDGKILKVWELGDVKSLEQQLYPEDEM